MFNIKEAIEKDITNINIKSLFVVEKEDNHVIEAWIFGSHKNNKSIYFIASAFNNEKWKLENCEEFKDFNSAMKKFAENKKSFLKQKPILC